jgi:hypothetical protein
MPAPIHLVALGVDEAPQGTIVPLDRETFRVPGRDDLYIVACLYQTARQIRRVPLHPTDSVDVAGDRDDADPQLQDPFTLANSSHLQLADNAGRHGR